MIDPVELRRFIYERILDDGQPPSSVLIAGRFGTTRGDALQALANLRIGKAVLVHPVTGEIWMAGPFSSVPTQYVVEREGRQWWGNCVWDLLGAAVLVGQPVRLLASCIESGEPFVADVDPARGISSDWVTHLLLPARRWYEDVGYT
jgi:hypothetical protein